VFIFGDGRRFGERRCESTSSILIPTPLPSAPWRRLPSNCRLPWPEQRSRFPEIRNAKIDLWFCYSAFASLCRSTPGLKIIAILNEGSRGPHIWFPSRSNSSTSGNKHHGEGLESASLTRRRDVSVSEYDAPSVKLYPTCCLSFLRALAALDHWAPYAGLSDRPAGVLLWGLHLAAIYEHEHACLC
jgi:hypothetical protein